MKTMKFKTAVITAIFCVAFVSVSMAQAQRGNDRKKPPTYAELLEQMDKNEDGKLAKSEIKGPLKNDFDKVDTNEDGFISEKEFKKAPKPQRREKK